MERRTTPGGTPPPRRAPRSTGPRAGRPARARASPKAEERAGVLRHARRELLERLPAELGHARGGDREIGRLVALAPVGLGREERAVGLDDEAGGGHHPRDPRKRAGPRGGHRAGKRGEQAPDQGGAGERRGTPEALPG